MKKFLFVFLLIFLFLPVKSLARTPDQITDCYFKDFQEEIVVNKDSSLLITERIIADCGNLPNKRGIFKSLPLYFKTDNGEKIFTPIELISITDSSGKSLKYTASQDSNALTWKIGDPNKTISGENTYLIKYLVKNTIRFTNAGFDEFYWNVFGNLWQLETDSFTGSIQFPEEINRDNTQIWVYSGLAGNKTNNLSKYYWKDKNTLQINSVQALKPGEAITVSATFPKNIITPYTLTPWQTYGFLLYLLIPIVTLIKCIQLWRRYGKDKKLKRPLVVQFEIPDNLSPIEFGAIYFNGKMKNQSVSAAIINLAVKGYLVIEELEGGKDFLLVKKNGTAEISEIDQTLLDFLLFGKDSVKISDIKYSFATKWQKLNKMSRDFIKNNGYFEKKSFDRKQIMLVTGIATLIIGFIVLLTLPFVQFNISILMLSLMFSSIIVIIFSFFMHRRTDKGVETLWKIEGFKHFMEVAEKYRQQFNEKEKIFEKLLPYAMLFGLTKVWIGNMKSIYSEDRSGDPVNQFLWYHSLSGGYINFKTFEHSINNMTSEISSSISMSSGSSSGSGGGGFSGGGGGGGGGGSW